MKAAGAASGQLKLSQHIAAGFNDLRALIKRHEHAVVLGN